MCNSSANSLINSSHMHRQLHSSSLVSDKQSTQEFPFGTEVCSGRKESKITTQRLDDLEV